MPTTAFVCHVCGRWHIGLMREEEQRCAAGRITFPWGPG